VLERLLSCVGARRTARRERAPAGATARAAAAARVLDGFGPVSRVLGAQLASAVHDTEVAANDIVALSDRIHQRSTASTDFITERIAEGRTEGHCDAAGLHEHLATIQGLNDYVAARQVQLEHDLRSLEAVLGDVDRMQELVDLVRHVSLQTHVLAINAGIEAARAGERGAGFRVLADEMRRLAGEAKQALGEVGQRIGAVHAQVRVQVASRRADSERERAGLAGLATGLAAFHGRVERLQADHDAVLARIRGSSEELSSHIMELLAKLQFQDIMRQRVEHVIERLGDAAEAIGGVARYCREAGSAVEPPPALSTDGLYEGYVMENQREVHSAAVGAAEHDRSATAMIELF
jgi:methyl-accepting chemotaxis protein